MPLTSGDLQLVVREPYTPAGEQLKLTRLMVSGRRELVVHSKIREGRLFIDGPHEVMSIDMGDTLVFRRSPEKLTLLGIGPRRRWGQHAD